MDPVPPILINFPHSFETERLLIRLPLPGDGEQVYEAIMESLESLQPWMPWAQHPPTREETEASVRQAHCKFLERTDLRFHLFEKEKKVFIGSSGLHRIDWRIPKFEIGYWCRKSYTGRGYITESVRGLTVFAFEILKANRVEIRCDQRNVRSRKVAERLGYRLEGTLRNSCLAVDNRLENTCVYSMIPEEFRSLSLQQSDGAVL
ncbi:GNAT family N-acetyltransferase [Lihuaxuella thermophila]|uniref:Protein N-acetyltransferase, RimJ/RimL family n=1 Tax=Lihuaxuella thermophila TaxID=1173111 RepID=A0A1H8DE76_9BACL|nr:GNAT family N-acetyltransferase [Lihuaxuella thermophila]SEN05124.1 Protein N-acetyltransferase, RimJ/RimL family [Lihuaxuella thermophila]